VHKHYLIQIPTAGARRLSAGRYRAWDDTCFSEPPSLLHCLHLLMTSTTLRHATVPQPKEDSQNLWRGENWADNSSYILGNSLGEEVMRGLGGGTCPRPGTLTPLPLLA